MATRWAPNPLNGNRNNNEGLQQPHSLSLRWNLAQCTGTDWDPASRDDKELLNIRISSFWRAIFELAELCFVSSSELELDGMMASTCVDFIFSFWPSTFCVGRARGYGCGCTLKSCRTYLLFPASCLRVNSQGMVVCYLDVTALMFFDDDNSQHQMGYQIQ